MNRIIFLLLALPLAAKSQSDLVYYKRIAECENKWVALEPRSDTVTKHAFGYIYIDSQAGWTFDLGGMFTIGPDKKFIRDTSMEKLSVKYRLEPKQFSPAVISPEHLRELGLQDPPDWLEIYNGKDSIGRLTRRGFWYDDWEEPELALPLLEKAYSLDPDHPGLAFEMAFCYNALEKYRLAIPVLERALQKDPTDCLFYKELSFALLFTGDREKAGEVVKKGIPLCTDPKLKAELAYNMAWKYAEVKDKPRYKEWAAEARKWAEEKSQFAHNLLILDKQIEQ